MIEEILRDQERVEKRKASLFPGVITLIVGLLLSFIAYSRLTPAGLVSELMMAAGVVLAITGLSKILLRGDIYYDKQSGSRFRYYQFYFDYKDLKRVKEIVRSGNYAALADIRICPQGGVTLHICGTSEGSLYYLLLMKYVPFQFVPDSEVIELTERDEIKEIELLLENKC